MSVENPERNLPAGTVTFLFTDIEGSTSLLQQLKESYATLLGDQREILRAAFDKWEGREIDTQGDSFFASFPRATQAVLATIDIQRALAQHHWPEDVQVRVRIGLHTGEPLVAGEGYVGMDVHRAARIAHVGHGGQVLLSETTAPLVKGELPEGVTLLDLGRHRLKDIQDPEHIHQLVISGLPSEFPPLKSLEQLPPQISLDAGEIELPAFLKEAVEPGSFPVFVGRERELARLGGFLDQASAGRGSLAFITGGTGRGKTALMEAFSRRAMEAYPDLLVASGNCNAYTGIGDPYLPFKDIFDMLTGAVESRYLSRSISREHALRLWEALPQTLEAIFNYGPHIVNSLLLAPALKSRVEIAIPAHVHLIQKLDASILSQRVGSGDIEQSHLFQQITNVLEKLATKHPILLILDDLQWADSASINLLFHIGRRLGGSHILIIGAYRPVDIALGRNQIRHPLETILAEFKRMYGNVWVDLGRVEEESDRRFVGLLLDTQPNLLDTRFRNTLFKHTGGHPLFTIELLRALQERRDLVKDQDEYWITTPELDWKTLPARIEGVIEERIGHLDDDLREILSIASVEGEEFTLQVVASLKGVNERLLLNSLSQELDKIHRLIKEDSVQRVGDKRLHTFRFRHNLFQQYLYGELGEIEREWLHGEIAAALENLYGEEAHHMAPQLAFHFKLADIPKKAQHYLVEAGRQARDRYANQEAIGYYSQALELMQREDVDSHYLILLEREKVHALMGNRQERATDLDSLSLLVETLEDMDKQAEVTLRMAKFAGSTGDYPKAIAAAEQSASYARETGNKELAANAQIEWGRALAFTGELNLARSHLMEALSLARDAQAVTGAQASWSKIEAGSLNNMGYISNIQGDHTSSNDYLEQALEINRQIGDRRGEGVMLQNLGVVNYDQGDFVNAENYWEKALRIFQEIGDRRHEAMVMNSLGNISSDLRGDYNEAQLKYEGALTIAQEVGDRLTEGMLLANIGLALSYQHDFDGAKGYIQQAMEIYVDIDLRPEIGGIYLDSGNALTGLKQLDEAVKYYTKAIQCAEEFDNRENILEAKAGLARIAQLRGEKVRAVTLVEAILIQMVEDQAQNPIEPEAEMRAYLICYQILKANLDPRAEEVLQTAYTLLQEQADMIPEDGIRQMFLVNIPWHHEIVESYLKDQ